MGVIFSIIAGAAMSIQGVLNTGLSEKAGLLESNVFVQGTAFIFSLAAMLLFGKGSFPEVFGANWIYLTGGVFGIVITVTVMLAIGTLSPTVAVSIILISQLAVAAVIDAFGLFGAEKVTFGWTKITGLFLMTGGVILFKLCK